MKAFDQFCCLDGGGDPGAATVTSLAETRQPSAVRTQASSTSTSYPLWSDTGGAATAAAGDTMSLSPAKAVAESLGTTVISPARSRSWCSLFRIWSRYSCRPTMWNSVPRPTLAPVHSCCAKLSPRMLSNAKRSRSTTARCHRRSRLDIS